MTTADDPTNKIISLQARQIDALPLVWPVLETLGVQSVVNEIVDSQADIDLGQIVLLLTLNRLLSPQPLYQVQDWLAQTILPEFLDLEAQKVYDNRLGRGLDRLYPYLGELWARLASRAIIAYKLDLTAIHWDITSIYFEGAYLQSELATYGYSRDHRPDTKQVNLQVDVTHDGYVPLLYELLSGNCADITRPVPHLHALLAFLGRPELADKSLRPILISDCKMITAEAAAACEKHKLFYLGPVADSRAMQTLLQTVTREELKANPLAYRPQRVKTDHKPFEPYCGVWRPFAFEHEGQTLPARVLVMWSAGKERLDEQKRKTYLKRLLTRLADIQKMLNSRRYKKRAYVEQMLTKARQGNPAQSLVEIELSGEDGALCLTFRLDQNKLQAAKQLDGRYALATNASQLAANEALTLFKGQDGVEKTFRTIKGPLQVRPLFVQKDQRVEGLVFVTLLAMLVRALVVRQAREQGLSVTADQLWRGFAGLQAVDIRWQNGVCERQVVDLTAFQQDVLQALSWDAPVAYVRSP